MAKGKVYNASDKEQVKDADKKNKNRRKQELEDIKNIIARPEGMRFFRRLMEAGKVFDTTFTGNSNGYFLEGHRNLALIFFADIVDAAKNKVAELVIGQVGGNREE